jgi:hypothetical protein
MPITFTKDFKLLSLASTEMNECCRGRFVVHSLAWRILMHLMGCYRDH